MYNILLTYIQKLGKESSAYFSRLNNLALSHKKALQKFLESASSLERNEPYLSKGEKNKIVQNWLYRRGGNTQSRILNELNISDITPMLEGPGYVMTDPTPNTSVSPTMFDNVYAGLVQARLYMGTKLLKGFNTASGAQNFVLKFKSGSLAHIMQARLRHWATLFNGSSIATHELVKISRLISLGVPLTQLKSNLFKGWEPLFKAHVTASIPNKYGNVVPPRFKLARTTVQNNLINLRSRT